MEKVVSDEVEELVMQPSKNRGSLSAPTPYLPTATLKNCALDYQSA
jgi:hypothetical protein